jgi:hypothetical protein
LMLTGACFRQKSYGIYCSLNAFAGRGDPRAR